MDLMIFRSHHRTLVKTDRDSLTTTTTRKEQRILHYLNEREFERTGGFTSGLFSTSHCVLRE